MMPFLLGAILAPIAFLVVMFVGVATWQLCNSDSAPKQYPVVIKVDSLTVGGARRAINLEIRPDCLRIRKRGSGHLLVEIPMERVTKVLFEDTSQEGKSMAGFAISCSSGSQYQFFSESVMAGSKMQRAATMIKHAYKAGGFGSLDVTNLNISRKIAADSLGHQIQ